MSKIDTSKPVWKVYGHLPPHSLSTSTGEPIGRVIIFVNAKDETSAIEAAKPEWPEGTTFQKAHEIDPATGIKKANNGS
jgi:hypothetical protein